MFISPKQAIEQGWITRTDCSSYDEWDARKFVSPNAIDFTLDTLKRLDGLSTAAISEDGKQMRQLLSTPAMTHLEYGKQPSWLLNHGTVYDGTSDMYVKLPDGVAAVLHTRSTLARNGVFLLSGLYDSGYNGHIGFTMYPIAGSIHITPGTRVGQIAFLAADSAKLYAGGWNHDSGTHYTQP